VISVTEDRGALTEERPASSGAFPRRAVASTLRGARAERPSRCDQDGTDSSQLLTRAWGAPFVTAPHRR
jgi:hypothetical protein